MALFSGNRDTQLFRKLSDELVDRILGTEIDIYKISNTLTKEWAKTLAKLVILHLLEKQ